MDSFSKCVFVRAGKHTSVHDMHPHSNVEGDVVLLQNLQPSSKIDNRWCESPYVVLNRPDINVLVYDIKKLSTGLIKTSHRNQLLLLFQTEGVVEPHLVKKKHITETVSDHVSDPDNHIDTSVVSASHTSTSDPWWYTRRV